MSGFRFDGPSGARSRLVLAHGAGAPMDDPFLETIAGGLAARGVRVARFEFPYMARRRREGVRRPPDRTPVLLDAWREALRALREAEPAATPPAIGGKSLGGRMASLLADELGAPGLVCLGYPFHPPGRPGQLRTGHLAALRTPTLIVQGTRDPFGTREEVAGYPLAPALRLAWIPDGDHSFVPRRASGRTQQQNLDEAVAVVADFLAAL
jgi:hypothetical protein